MTTQELRERQGWNLHQKIDHAVGAVESFIAISGKTPYVSYSGGKDSTILLDLVRRFVNRDIKGVYCNTGNEWPEILEFVRQTENIIIIRPDIRVKQVLSNCGFPLISKEQAQGIREAKHTKSSALLDKRLNGSRNSKYKAGKISDRWQFLINAEFEVSEKCCTYLKKRPFHRYEKETGEAPILGIMAEESDLRTLHYIRRGGCNSFIGRVSCHPMSIFTERDIYAYKTMFKIPFSKIYNIPGVKQTGCMFCGFGAQISKGFPRFECLYDLHPKAYKLFMGYKNNGVTYRDALRAVGVRFPDEYEQTRMITHKHYL